MDQSRRHALSADEHGLDRHGAALLATRQRHPESRPHYYPDHSRRRHPAECALAPLRLLRLLPAYRRCRHPRLSPFWLIDFAGALVRLCPHLSIQKTVGKEKRVSER